MRFAPKSHSYIFGKSQIVRHNYFDNFQLTTTAGTKGVYTFQINGMNDPNISGVGHQPIGFDQMAGFFGRYNVIGVNMKIKFWNRDADETMAVGLIVNEESTLPATYTPQRLIENGSMSYKLLPVVGTDFTNQQIQYMSRKVSIKKFCKVKSVMDYDALGSNPSSNPQRAVYAHIICWQPDGALTNAQISCYVEMEQLAVWTRPLTQEQS